MKVRATMKQRQPISRMSQLRFTIRNAGLRSTTPRIAVLRHLQHVAKPMSHAELFAALDEKGFDRAMATTLHGPDT